MVEIMRMPGVLAGAESGVVHSWFIQEGEQLAAGQTIAEIETEKATVEITADTAGTVGRLLVQQGDEVEIGAPILAILGDGDSPADIDAALSPGEQPAPQATAESPAVEEAPVAEESRSPAAADLAPADQQSQRLFASPLVRRLAHERGVDLTQISGTGPGGRIVRRDLERHLAESTASAPQPVADAAVSPPAPAPKGANFEDIPLTPMRKAIARRLAESKATVPHFYLTADCAVEKLLALREEINSAGTRRISVNDLVVKAVARALIKVPAANAVWNEESIRRFETADVAVAVAIDDGLVTPVVRNVDQLSISTLGETIADLAARSRSGGLKQHELEGGAFTVSNLGMFGTKEFSAIINPPQAGILAVGAARQEPVVLEGGTIAATQIMTVTLSADHRVLDGAVAAQWLAAFQQAIENPMEILL